MKSQNNIKCQECGLTTCVFGRIDNTNNENSDRIYFTPTGIRQKSFWKLINNSVGITQSGRVIACYNCGYMWGHVNTDKLQSVLSKLEWNGEAQQESKTINLPIIVERLALLIVISLALFIIFLYFKT